MRPLILISNDDGYNAKGIRELIRMIRDLGDIIVCAPDGGRSGKSRAFTMDALLLDHISTDDNVEVYSCSGTPVDCIKMAYAEICPRTPDIIIGGINHGDNASTNAHYSGTVGIVIEGAMKGIPSIAFSLCDYDLDADFTPMQPLIHQLIGKVLREGLPRYTCLNVNYPKGIHDAPVKICRMGHGHWLKEVEKCTHPTRGYNYYFMCGYYQNDEPDAEDTDAWAIAHGFASITPVTVDITDYSYLGKLKEEFDVK